MLYSMATVCLSGTLRQKISAIAEAGFQSIEIFENDLIAHNGSVREIRTVVEDNNLNVVAYQPFRDFEGLPEPLRSQAFRRAERKFDIMEELGTDLLMICSSCSRHASGGVQRAADDFATLGDMAKQRNMRVCFEALAWGSYVNDYRDAWEIVRRANHSHVGLCLDTFHMFSRQTELNSMLNIPNEKIFLVQVADAPQLSMDHLSWSRHYRCFPGQGELPLNEFIDNLNEMGYDGPLSLEIFNDQFRSGSASLTAKNGYRSLVYLANKSETKPGDEDSIQNLTLPDHAPPSDIQFIEFAIGNQEHKNFCSLLAQLGFVHTANHNQKTVEHWQQGQVNFLINLEPESFAQRYYREHGISVCAVGLLCESVENLIKRSTQLGYPPVTIDSTIDTHGIPSVEGPGRMHLYFVDKQTQPDHWEREFTPCEGAQLNAWLDRIDHVSMSMDYETMLSAVLQYRSVLGMRSTPSVDISDPGGLVKSQVMQTADRNVSLTLNSTQAQSTVSKKILNTYSGAGVNHIAVSTSDIFQLAQQLKDNLATVMTVPINYYEDLAARFSLSGEVLEKMKGLNILYDEDDGGKFYQLYTTFFENRFCFEIVQRDGYTGFGVPNAQIRMTMQSQELNAPEPNASA